MLSQLVFKVQKLKHGMLIFQRGSTCILHVFHAEKTKCEPITSSRFRVIMHLVSSRRQPAANGESGGFNVKLRSTKSRGPGSPSGENEDEGGNRFSVKLRSTKSRNPGSPADDADAPAGEMFSVKLRSTKSRAVGSPGGENDEGGNRFSVKLRSAKSNNPGSSTGADEGREGEMFKVKLKKTKRGGEARVIEDNNAGVPQLAGLRKKKKKRLA